MKRGRVTAEAREAIERVALARLQRPKVLTDAELCAQFGLSKACIHRIMQQVKLSVCAKTSDTPSLNPPLETQTASEGAMP
jgi:hypothetical protein